MIGTRHGLPPFVVGLVLRAAASWQTPATVAAPGVPDNVLVDFPAIWDAILIQ